VYDCEIVLKMKAFTVRETRIRPLCIYLIAILWFMVLPSYAAIMTFENECSEKAVEISNGEASLHVERNLGIVARIRLFWDMVKSKFSLGRRRIRHIFLETETLVSATRRGRAHRRMAYSLPHFEADFSACFGKAGCEKSLEVFEPYPGMFLQVVHHTRLEAQYELIELAHLELGIAVKHVSDFAYTPVGLPLGRDANDDQTGLVGSCENDWWIWWLPRDQRKRNAAKEDEFDFNETAFAGGSHGEVWRGKRRCRQGLTTGCKDNLVFKRLRVERGYRILEAGLREVYFGSWLAERSEDSADQFTRYIDHFFREQDGRLELWIVFKDAGASLRSFLYTGSLVGNYVVYQHSRLWTHIRLSVSGVCEKSGSPSSDGSCNQSSSIKGKQLMRMVLGQVLRSAAFLHENGIIHRDIKPSNIMCTTDLDMENFLLSDLFLPSVKCVLGDFSSAWDDFSGRNFYTRGPSRAEQTDEYSPPESVFKNFFNGTIIDPSFDSWSIGIVALELLLGTPNVFSVDQRTKAIISHKMRKEGASDREINYALYLYVRIALLSASSSKTSSNTYFRAALSQFCIFNPSLESQHDWPLRRGDPLHSSAMVKDSCTISDFHFALRARDPLGIGFDSSTDTLLHLVWQLLEWNPTKRISPYEALRHPYFSGNLDPPLDATIGSHNALESLMLDPRLDFKLSDSITEFFCPQCGRVFHDWGSCHQHAVNRKHAKFCRYDKTSLPSCINAHSLLPTHSKNGYCDIQGRRRFIEDFHAVHLLPSEQFYGIFDGHLGNAASKFVAATLYEEVSRRLSTLKTEGSGWKEFAVSILTEAFADVHRSLLQAIRQLPYRAMDQSGTTATVMYIRDFVVIASLGDSRAVLASNTTGTLRGIQLTTDHVASDPVERQSVESRGGIITKIGNVDRVSGSLVVTRSIGDADLADVLSQVPDVLPFSMVEMRALCGYSSKIPCFVILASDGLWDRISNQEAVDIVADVVAESNSDRNFQSAAEALVHESFVRGSSDNIGVCVVAVE
jgi:serine/threonine protein phosphatase PrpC